MTTWQRNGQSDDARRFARIPHKGDVRYCYGGAESGVAALRDIGRGGMRVQMDRYLRPSTRVLLVIDSLGKAEVEMKAEVIWCRQVDEDAMFQSGLRIYYDVPEAVETVSDLVRQAWRGVMMGGVIVPLIQPAPVDPRPFLPSKGMQEACGGL